MEEDSADAQQTHPQTDRFSYPFPIGIAGRNDRSRRQTVSLGPLDVVKDVNHMRPFDGWRIVNAGIGKTRDLAQLFCAPAGNLHHVGFGAKLQAAGRACLNASRFETLPYTVGTERTLVNLLRLRMKLRNIEWTA